MNFVYFPRILRGDIFYVDFGNQPGSVIHGVRPAMVIQNNVGNWHSTTLVVAAITTALKKDRQPTHIWIGEQFGLPRESMLQLEQLYTVDKYSLETYVGTASDDFLESVNWALAISVGLHPKICNINYDEIPENQRPMNEERRTRYEQ